MPNKVNSMDQHWLSESVFNRYLLNNPTAFQAHLNEVATRRTSVQATNPLTLETIQLFNPFHSKADGRFASGKGGGGGGGLGVIGGGGSPDKAGVITGMQLKKDVLAKATAKKGFPVKTTGAILGLAGLGLVGVAILSSKKEDYVGPVRDGQGLDGTEDQTQILSETQQFINQYNSLIPPDSQMPKGLTMAQYEQQARADLSAMGIDTVFDGKVNTADGDKLAIMRDHEVAGMFYGGDFYMTPEMAAGLQNGERFPYLVMLHELAHSNQEGFSEITDSIERGFARFSGVDPETTHALIEGQNDLYARMAMSRSTGIPESTSMTDDLQDQLNRTYKDAQSSYSLLSQDNRSKVALPDQANVVTEWNDYQPYVFTYAALVIAAEKKGIGPMEYMNKHHISGVTISGQATAINEIFPSLASPGVGGIGASIPSQAELNRLLQEQGIDGQAAYEELMRRAAAGEL